LYPCYKIKFLNIHRPGYEYFKDSSVVYLDMLYFDLAVASSMKNNNNKKMEKWGYLAKD